MDLFNEMKTAGAQIGGVQLAHLRMMGALNPGVARMGARHVPFGLMRIQPLDDGMFVPTDNGRLAMVVPVFEDGELLDIVAFHTSEPETYWLRTGAGGLLGLVDGWGRHEWADSVRLHATPLDWLRAGGDGLCVLDWDAPEVDRINGLQAVTVSNPALKKLLLDTLARPYRLVPVSICADEGLKNVA